MNEADVARHQIEEDVRKFFAFTGAQRPPDNAVFILVMGMTGAGKSSFVASCTERPVTVGHTFIRVGTVESTLGLEIRHQLHDCAHV